MNSIQQFINSLLKWSYQLFQKTIDPRKLMDYKTFTYAMCGGINMLLGWIAYFVIYHLFFRNIDIDLIIVNKVLSGEIFTLILVWFINLFVGFLLMRYIVFTDSARGGKQQLLLYFLSSKFSFLLNVILLKGLLSFTSLYPTVANICSTIIVVLVSYIIQRKITFK